MNLVKSYLFTKTSAYAFGGMFLGTVVLQHIANVNEWNRSPKTEIIRGFNATSRLATTMGTYAARLCSYLYHLKLHKFGRAFWDVLGPILQYLTVPYYFCEGYVTQALTYTHPGVVYLGGLVAAVGIVVAVDWKWGVVRRFW